ncbi:serine/threonine protein kinase [Myxococcus hansupus]|nr:serine/threonine-protein kinase [Myxococcus hansupus]
MYHPAQLQPGQWVDGWRVVCLLGAGTYGAVYRVEKNGRHFAMKLAMHRASSGDAEQADARLQRELGCLVHLSHPNIIASRAHGRWPDLVTGWLYVILDLVEGYTLAEWVERMHPTAQEVARVFGKLAAALDYMHGRGVFHRDLKLGNIMVRASDGAPLILDFSAGDYTNAEDLTDAPLPPGTRRYRTPEAYRFLRENGDNRAARYEFKVTDDVYALGVCLFDVLTAPEPTSGSFKAPVEGRWMPPPARVLNPRVPESLSDAAMNFIARKPEHRPPTAEVMRRKLEAFATEAGPEWTTPLHHLATKPRFDPATGTEAPLPSRPRPWRRVVLLGAVLAMGGAAAVTMTRSSPPEAPAQIDGSVPASSPPRDTGPVALVESSTLLTPPEVDAGVSWDARSPPRVPASSPAGVALPPPVPVQKESPAVKRAPTVASPSEAPAKKALSSGGNGAEFLKKCAAASAAVALQLGCPSSAQLRPTSSECPAEAIDAMFEKLHLVRGSSTYLNIDMEQPGEEFDMGVFGDGPVRGIVTDGDRRMPNGTILDGQLWTGDGRFYARYTRARYPDGKSYPVCIVIGGWGPEDGREGSKPGAVVFPRSYHAYWVTRWP